MNIIKRAKFEWESQCDEYNSWDSLDIDEKFDLIIKQEQQELKLLNEEIGCCESVKELYETIIDFIKGKLTEDR